jgi:hypothetical protein
VRRERLGVVKIEDRRKLRREEEEVAVRRGEGDERQWCRCGEGGVK